jgi:hypothetical protein
MLKVGAKGVKHLTSNFPKLDDTFTILGESDNFRSGKSDSVVILVP